MQMFFYKDEGFGFLWTFTTRRIIHCVRKCQNAEFFLVLVFPYLDTFHALIDISSLVHLTGNGRYWQMILIWILKYEVHCVQILRTCETSVQNYGYMTLESVFDSVSFCLNLCKMKTLIIYPYKIMKSLNFCTSDIKMLLSITYKKSRKLRLFT